MKKNIFFLLVLSFFNAQAQIDFDAEVNRDEISIDETLTINYTIRTPDFGKMQNYGYNLSLPDFEGFDVLSTRRWNEQVQSNNDFYYSEILSLTLKPRRSGKIVIPPAIFEYNGKEIRSKSFNIQVDKSSKTPDVASTNNKMKDGYLAFEVSNPNPYQNENIFGELVFYAVNPFYLENIRRFTPPKFEGFTANIIDIDDSTISRKIVNGRNYYKRVIYKVLLTPTKNGQLTIAPNEAEILVADGYYGQRPVKIKSGNVKINVRKLPSNAPQDFTGAVGNFAVKVQSPPKKIKAKETVDLDVQVKGNGNFMMVKVPEIKVPKEIEKYKPVKQKDIDYTENGERGFISEKTVLVPQETGNYTVKVNSFSYFDPLKNKYISLPAQSFNILVEGISTNIVSNTDDNEALERIDESDDDDDKLIANLNVEPKDKSNNYGTWAAVGGGLLVAAMALFAFIRKKKEKEKGNGNESDQNDLPENIAIGAPSYIFNHVKNAYLQKDFAELYKEIEQMLKRAKPHLEGNNEMKNDYQALSNLVQHQKYAPFMEEGKNDELYQKSENFYRKYFG